MSVNTDFRKGCSSCFANRNFLRRVIEDIDYDLANSHQDVTTKDLFLGERGRRCVVLLLVQMKLQIKVYGEIRSSLVDAELQKILIDSGIPDSCIEILENHDLKQTPRIEDQEETTCVYFADGQAQGIKCDSLMHFADTFLMFIKQKLESHKKQCPSVSNCMYCITLEETFQEITPLLEDFGSHGASEYTNFVDNCDVQEELLHLPWNDTASAELDTEFSDDVEGVVLQVDYTWERFKEIVLNKYKNLRRRCSKYLRIDRGSHPVLLLYCDKNNDVKAVHCMSVTEAREKAYQINDISQDPFPVVLITRADNSETRGQTSQLPNAPSRKRMVHKKVGIEDSPSVIGKLKAPEGREPFEIELVFYIDTGADCGSVGYDFTIIKHFVLTVEKINNQLTPAIICKVAIGNEEQIQVYDIDENQHWNAIGLSILKKYHGMYIGFKNNKVELGKQEDVTETVTPDGSFQVTFRKDEKAESLDSIDAADLDDS